LPNRKHLPCPAFAGLSP